MRLIALAIAALLAGCGGTMRAFDYQATAGVADTLRQAQVGPVVVEDFIRTADFASLCRTSITIRPPEGMTFEEFIQKALQRELASAGIQAAGDKTVTLNGTVSRLAFSTSEPGSMGRWDIQLDLASSNGKRYTATQSMPYAVSFMGDAACMQTTLKFNLAVGQMLASMTTDPAFLALLRP